MDYEKMDNAASSAGLARLAKSIAGGSGSLAGAIAAAEAERAHPAVLAVLKAASSAASLADPEWAGSLASYAGLTASFIASLRGRSAFYTLASMTVAAPMRSHLVATAMIAASEIDEDTWIPVRQTAFTQKGLEPRTTGSIVVLTSELAASTDAAGFGVLRSEMEAGAVAAADRVLWSVATEGIVPAVASAAPLEDLRAMLNAVNTAGAGGLMWVLSPAAANAASTAADATGGRLFPSMGPTGGTLLNLPTVVSDGAPAGSIALLSASGFAANQGTVIVDESTASALQMADDPTGTASTLTSLWQANLVALRVRMRFGLARVRDDAVSIVGNVPAMWGAA